MKPPARRAEEAVRPACSSHTCLNHNTKYTVFASKKERLARYHLVVAPCGSLSAWHVLLFSCCRRSGGGWHGCFCSIAWSWPCEGCSYCFRYRHTLNFGLLACVCVLCLRAAGGPVVVGKLAYCSQVPWIMPASLRDNVTFQQQLEPARYNAVIDACALIHDLAELPAGDLTELGERGVNLSGELGVLFCLICSPLSVTQLVQSCVHQSLSHMRSEAE